MEEGAEHNYVLEEIWLSMTKEEIDFINNTPKDDMIMHCHGHKMYIGIGKDCDGEPVETYYNYDTDEPYATWKNNVPPCPKCKMAFIKDKSGLIDPCLGKLPGVKFACCGHGVNDGYIMFDNGRIIRFDSNIQVEQGIANKPPILEREDPIIK